MKKSKPITKPVKLPIANHARRLANHVIDLFVLTIGSFVIGTIFSLVVQPGGEYNIGRYILIYAISIAWLFFYYSLLEVLFGKTIGKLITQTKVVTMEGKRPSKGTILFRTMCRLIPFEAFSFLKNDAIGWHDSMTKTRVVQKKVSTAYTENTTAPQMTTKKTVVIVLFSLLGFAILLTGLLFSRLYLYSRYKDQYRLYEQLKNNPENAAQTEESRIIAKVRKLITLPKDEMPTIATVLDKSKLADQPFFKDAENGDKILIYTKEKKAIIYRESTNSLINVGPIAQE